VPDKAWLLPVRERKHQFLEKFQLNGRLLGTPNMVNGILNDPLMIQLYPAIASMDG